MTSSAETVALEDWFRANSGHLHRSVRILQDGTAGVHYRATATVETGATIASAPHSITLSYLNALVDDGLPVFKQHRHRFKIEAIGIFYLMAQYINRKDSFWKPYLDSLPAPDQDFSQPLFFKSPDDVAWLEDTDVWHTVTARKDVYRTYFEDGVAVLKEAGIDVQNYTWHLFIWAATIFTSRSFTSRALHPGESKYWTTYKSTPDGRRQTVLLDMSRTPAEDLDFPVLFPGLDAANHSHETRVDWTFDPGRFSVVTNDMIETGVEVFNNYGPKGNGELLIGYGFCILNNPYDTVALTFKAPPMELQSELKIIHPGYFTALGDWNAEKATFRLPSVESPFSDPSTVFQHLPESLLELLIYIIRHEHNQDFSFIPQPFQYLQSGGDRYLPHIARMIAQYLLQKLTQLQSTTLPQQPANRKQAQAATYRQGQFKVLQDTISALKQFTRSLIWTPSTGDRHLPERPCLVRLEHFLEALRAQGRVDDAFLEGIQESANTSDIEQLRLAGWEEDLWVLLLCYVRLDLRNHGAKILRMIPEYPWDDDMDVVTADVGGEQADMAMDIVHTAAAAYPNSLWNDERWSAKYLARFGGSVLANDSFNVMCTGEDGVEGPRLLIYLHPPWL